MTLLGLFMQIFCYALPQKIFSTSLLILPAMQANFLYACQMPKFLQGFPRQIIWIFIPLSPLYRVSESFRQDIGQISTWKVVIIENKSIMKNLTDSCIKTVKTVACVIVTPSSQKKIRESAMGEGYGKRCESTPVLYHFSLLFLQSEDEIT